MTYETNPVTHIANAALNLEMPDDVRTAMLAMRDEIDRLHAELAATISVRDGYKADVLRIANAPPPLSPPPLNPLQKT
jgi:hypothetical protein